MYDPERLRQVTEALIGENHALYHSSAFYRHRIDLYAQTAMVAAEDAAKFCSAAEEDLAERIRKAERDRHPAFLVEMGKSSTLPICAEQSPALVIEGHRREVCVLKPGHEGPHQGRPNFYPGGDPMTWSTGAEV